MFGGAFMVKTFTRIGGLRSPSSGYYNPFLPVVIESFSFYAYTLSVFYPCVVFASVWTCRRRFRDKRGDGFD